MPFFTVDTSPLKTGLNAGPLQLDHSPTLGTWISATLNFSTVVDVNAHQKKFVNRTLTHAYAAAGHNLTETFQQLSLYFDCVTQADNADKLVGITIGFRHGNKYQSLQGETTDTLETCLDHALGVLETNQLITAERRAALIHEYQCIVTPPVSCPDTLDPTLPAGSLYGSA